MIIIHYDNLFFSCEFVVVIWHSRYINAIPIIHDANWTATFSHASRSDNYTVTGKVLRHQPILSMFAMPFPLVCSVVAVVACSRSDHIMVI
jgi:hypothetical protein